MWSDPRLALARRPGVAYLDKGEPSRAWRKSPQLFAPDDLPDPRMIEADQLADVSEREPGLLGLGKGCAAGLPRGLAIAFELLLSRLYSAADLPLIVGAHHLSLFAEGRSTRPQAQPIWFPGNGTLRPR